MMPFNSRMNPDWVRVAGDIHGHAEALSSVIRRASADGIGLLLAGDLVNRGPASPEVVRMVLSGIEAGLVDFVPGNHDVLLAKLLTRRPRPDDPQTVVHTRAQFDAHPDGRRLAHDFVRAVTGRPAWRRLGDCVIAHAGFDPRMLWRDPAALNDPDPDARAAARKAVWGERTRPRDGAKPQPSYGWMDTVPPGIKVVIGHDTRSTEKIVRRASVNGGRVIHVDCGLGSGGRLATLDLSTRAHRPDRTARLYLTVRAPDDGRLARLARAHPDARVVDARGDLVGGRARAREHLADGADVLLAGDHTLQAERFRSVATVPPSAPVSYLDAPADLAADGLGNVTRVYALTDA